MRETVTVKQDVSRGQWTIIFPALLMLFGSIITSIVLVAQLDLNPWYIVIGVVVGFALMFFYWNTTITKWRIWAFENVRNVHELKRKAIEKKLISDDGSWSERCEIRNYDQKQKLKQLEKKFLEKDVYHDDFNVPKETIIKHSVPGNFLMLALGLGMLAAGIYPLVTGGDKSYYLIIPFVIGGFLLFTTIKALTEKEPQIVLNSNGIKLFKKEFMDWPDVTNDFIETRKNGKYVQRYLVLDYRNQPVEIMVGNLDVPHDKIEELLRVYRVRYEKNK